MKKLYIVHGWTYDLAPWQKTIEELKKLGIDTEMLRVPGLTQPSDRVWSIQNYAGWANHNIPDGAIALGHSNGGRILLNLLSNNPKKLSGVILLDAAGVDHELTAKQRTAFVASKVFSPFKKIKPVRKAFHKVTGASDYGMAPENMKKTLDNMLRSDKSLDIGAVTTPTQIIWGDADTVTPLADAQKLNEAIKGSELTVKKGWTHAAYIDHPEELAQAIKVAYEALAG